MAYRDAQIHSHGVSKALKRSDEVAVRHENQMNKMGKERRRITTPHIVGSVWAIQLKFCQSLNHFVVSFTVSGCAQTHSHSVVLLLNFSSHRLHTILLLLYIFFGCKQRKSEKTKTVTSTAEQEKVNI